METSQRVLEIDGGRLVTLVAGDGPLVVLTHALGPLAFGDVERLAQSCTVAIPDWEQTTLGIRMRFGFGWFEPLVRALGHERATLCAWSMSGPGAVYFAAEQPSALSRLILVDLAGVGEEESAWRWTDVLQFIWMRIRGRPTRGFVRMLWRDWVWQEGFETQELEAATLRFFRATPEAFGMSGEEDEEDEEDEESLLDELTEIAVPTLVLAGRHSKVLGPKAGLAAVERLPRGELCIFEASGHALQLEEPERFQEVVAQFAVKRA